jgi:hypothetical protein
MSSFIFAAAAFVIFIPFAILDFDPHHDGYMLAQALSVNQGGFIYTDAFAQYGPGTTWFQSLFTGAFWHMPAVGIRVSNVLVLSLTIFVMADFGRKMPDWWPVNNFSAKLAALIWFFTADVFYSVPMLPWSSALATLLALSTLYLVGRALKQSRGSSRATYLIIAGSFAAYSIFTKLNVGVPLLALIIGLLILSRVKQLPIPNFKYFAFAFISTSLLVIGILQSTNALKESLIQSIIWPLQWSGATKQNLGLNFLYNYWSFSLPFVITLGLITIWTILRYAANSDKRSASKLEIILLIGTTLVLLASTIFELFGKSTMPMAIRAIPYQFVEKVALIIQFLVAAGITVAILLGGISLIKYFQSSDSQILKKSLGMISLCGISFVTILQVTPIADSRHIWWGLPPLLLLLVSIFSFHANRWQNLFRNPLVYTVSALLYFAPLIGLSYLNMPRTQISTPSAANGMLSMNAEAQAIEEIAKAIRGKIPQSRDTLFLVFDGYISVADGHYRSSDPYFVSWGPIPDVNSRLSKAKYVVLENKDEINPEIINKAGFKLMSNLKAYSLYKK